MTRDEGVALIKQQLAFRQTLDSAIVTQMKFAQTTLESGKTKPWFLVTDTTLTTVVDTPNVAFPSGFLGEVEESHWWYRPSDWPATPERELVKDDYDDLRTAYRKKDPGKPRAYAVLGRNFYFFPTPDDAYSIRGQLYMADTVLDTNVENGWLREIPMLLLGTALRLISVGPIRDQVAGGVATEWIATGNELLRAQQEQFRSVNREDQIGGRHW